MDLSRGWCHRCYAGNRFSNTTAWCRNGCEKESRSKCSFQDSIFSDGFRRDGTREISLMDEFHSAIGGLSETLESSKSVMRIVALDTI